MFVIWAKLYKEDKIVKSALYRCETKYSGKDFHGYLTEICTELDCPTPVVLKAHLSNFEHFNVARFKTRDFVESVDFDYLLLEYVPPDRI